MKQLVLLVGTLDTKGEEYLYIKSLFDELKIPSSLIDVGIMPHDVSCDVTGAEVAGIAGYDIEELRRTGDRGQAVKAMMEGLMRIVPSLYETGKVAGIMGLGGSGGTALLTPAMRTLPNGVPKIMVSTIAEGDVTPFVGDSDLIMIPSIVDIAGLNQISRVVFRGAVQAMAGMIGCENTLAEDDCEKKPAIAATMYGVTTPCVTRARKLLEENGFEVVVFHASGNGGRTMERLIDVGAFCGVLDLTTTEWCDELFGGIMAAGSHRNEAASRVGIPQVVSVGAMDIVTFGPPHTVPDIYKDRNLHAHNPMITIMRTNKEENVRLGQRLASKLNLSRGGAVLLLPLKGVSAMDQEGEPFYGPEEDQALFDALKQNVDINRVPIIEMENHINDEVFGEAAAVILMEMIAAMMIKQ